ncbi:MAG: hypothetical protein ABIA93_07155 [Candidatus Woesearchaeota archaeon]
MAFLEFFTQTLLTYIVSYTYSVISILLVVKIIQAIMGAFGVGNGTGFPGGKGNKDGKNGKNGGDGGDGNGRGGGDGGKKTSDDDEDHAAALDFSALGGLRVLVTDIDKNPQPGVDLRIRALTFTKETPHAVKRRFKGMLWWGGLRGRTGRMGEWPDTGKGDSAHHQLPSGSYHITASNHTARGDLLLPSITQPGRYNAEQDVTIVAGKDQDIRIILKKESSKAKNFRPKIRDVKYVAQEGHEPVVEMTGVIK